MSWMLLVGCLPGGLLIKQNSSSTSYAIVQRRAKHCSFSQSLTCRVSLRIKDIDTPLGTALTAVALRRHLGMFPLKKQISSVLPHYRCIQGTQHLREEYRGYVSLSLQKASAQRCPCVARIL